MDWTRSTLDCPIEIGLVNGNGLIMDVQIGKGFLLDLQKWPCIDIVVTRDSSSENDGVLRVVGPHSTRSLSSMRDVRTDWL